MTIRTVGAIIALLAMGVALFFAGRMSPRSFDEITVKRINVVEDDGTLRMTIAGRDNAPGLYVKGEERPREEDRPTAGMFFMNDEGSEVGGLIFGGKKTEEGDEQSHGHLSFDQYGGTQVLALQGFEQDGVRSARLRFWDWRNRGEETGNERLWLGKGYDGEVGLVIKDKMGRPRIQLVLDENDEPKFVVLDEEGSVTTQIPL